MKDGRTHLAHKAEHAVDMATGAILAITIQGVDQGDTTTLKRTLAQAEHQIEAVRAGPAVGTRRACRRWWRTRATTAHAC
jgi:transposase